MIKNKLDSYYFDKEQDNYNNNYDNKDWLDKFTDLKSVFIKEKINLGNSLIGFNSNKIKYEIYEGFENEEKNKIEKKNSLFKISINNSYSCLTPIKCNKAKFNAYNDDENSENLDKNLILANKQYSCTFLCSNRPEWWIYNLENKKENFLGKIIDSWECTNYSITIIDEFGNPIFIIRTNICQSSICCYRYNNKKCNKIILNIYNYSNKEFLFKITKDILENKEKNILKDNGYYSIPYSKDFHWKDKILIIFGTIFFDYQILSKYN